jgi:hypothetical protein
MCGGDRRLRFPTTPSTTFAEVVLYLLRQLCAQFDTSLPGVVPEFATIMSKRHCHDILGRIQTDFHLATHG